MSELSRLPLDVLEVVAVSNLCIVFFTRPVIHCSFAQFLRFHLTADIALSQKLQEELNFETQSVKDAPSPPEAVTKFIEQGVWTVSIRRTSHLFPPLITAFPSIFSFRTHEAMTRLHWLANMEMRRKNYPLSFTSVNIY